MIDMVPPLEENIPLPDSAVEALPSLSPAEELDMRVRTIQLLSEISGNPLLPDAKDITEANQLAHQMIANPKFRPDFAKYPNESIAFLAGMVAQCNVQLVDELSEFKNYVITKLVHEIEHADAPKDRIAALRLLGDVEGVDAYKRRSEMTMMIKPIEEVEKELKHVLESLEVSITPVETPDAHS